MRIKNVPLAVTVVVRAATPLCTMLIGLSGEVVPVTSSEAATVYKSEKGVKITGALAGNPLTDRFSLSLGTFLLDNDKLRRAFPGMRPGTSAAISDICISNGLSVAPYHSHSATARSGTSRTVTSIEELIVLHEA